MLVAASALALVPAAAQAGEVAVPVALDTYAKEAAPTVAHGAESIAYANGGGEPDEQVFLRFNIPAVGTITSAKLRLNVTNGSNVGFDVQRVADNGWRESLTWNTRPEVGVVVASSGSVGLGVREIDVTSAVTGSGALSLALTTSSTNATGIETREVGAGKGAQLILTTTAATTVPVTVDTYAKEASPTTGHGGEKIAYANGGSELDEIVYLRFDVPAMGAIKAARLRVNVSNTSPVGFDVRRVGDNAWPEALTWNTRPAVDAAVLASSGAVQLGVRDVDVTSAVTAGGAVSFALTTTSTNATGIETRETGPGLGAQLVLTADAAAAVTAPAAPTAFDARGVAGSGSTAQLKWAPATGVDAYEIVRDGEHVATAAGTASSYTDTKLAPASTYTYAVRAVNSAGTSALSANNAASTRTPQAGAQLPISYSLSSLTGTVVYIDDSGNDANAGTISAPKATIKSAIAKIAAAGSTGAVVVRGGTYHNQEDISIGSGKAIRIIAYPGEIPTFDGSQSAASGWTTEGSYSWHSYVEQPVTNASGMKFTEGQGLTGSGVGRYPDQAWVGATQLQQVTSKSSVTAGTFWVDAANDRIYLAATDVSTGGVAYSEGGRFLSVSGAGSALEGLRIVRYSNTASDYGVVLVNTSASNFSMRNVEIRDTAFQAMMLAGGANSTILKNPTLENITIDSANWMGVSSNYVDNLVMRRAYMTNLNQWVEFRSSPQTGALKTSRNRGTRVLNSVFVNNQSHVLWFDQSNYDVHVAHNVILNNRNTGVFYEISDRFTMVNNYLRGNGATAVKLAGASGLKLVANTIIGGDDGIGVYTDSRSKTGCADPSQPLCAGSYASDRDYIRTRPATLDWKPRIDLMIDNVIVRPTSTGLCGALAALCITTTNSTASNPINTIVHKADGTRGIPETVMNADVYDNNGGSLIRVNGTSYATTAAFTSAMAASPVYLSGIEGLGKHGGGWVEVDGRPTAALLAKAGEAHAVPTDGDVNLYIAAGTKRHGYSFAD